MFTLIMKEKQTPTKAHMPVKETSLSVHITEGDETILTQRLHSTDPTDELLRAE